MDTLNRWLTFITNLGVIVGLVLVAFEIRQTNTALERDNDAFYVDVYDKNRQGWREFNGRIIESAEVADIYIRGNRGETLDEVEQQRYSSLIWDWYHLYAQSYQQWSAFSDQRRDFDWSIHTVVKIVETERPGAKPIVKRILSESDDVFADRFKDLYPGF